LNARELQPLIAAGETLLIEFKGEARAPLSDDDVVEAIVCLANHASSGPAWLLIGVEDDGRVTGARPRHGDHTDRNRFQAMIANRTRPSLAVEADLVTLDGQAVLAIQVPCTRVPVGTTEGRYLRRVTGEAAGLCNMTERQASERLHRMTKAGKLKAVGERRGRNYVLP